MTDSEHELNALKQAWEELVASLESTPVIYNDKGDPVWAGKPIAGKNCAEEANKITEAKLKEYEERGEAAFADSEPLDNILRPGESRIV